MHSEKIVPVLLSQAIKDLLFLSLFFASSSVAAELKWAFAQEMDRSIMGNEHCRESLAQTIYAPQTRKNIKTEGANVFVYTGKVETYRIHAFESKKLCDEALSKKRGPANVGVGVERRNLSIDDVILGFRNNKMYYFEMILENGKYSRSFNKCLSSKPADDSWLKKHCVKKPEFKHAFECTEGSTLHVLFVYEDQSLCEETRQPMKDKMDAIKE